MGAVESPETNAGAGSEPTAIESVVAGGTLYVVSTPIGNLSDITLRALAVLQQVDRIAAEDTRHTRRLLLRHGIHPRAIEPYHAHNEQRMGPRFADRLRRGEAVALVTDAGTPGVSDPAYRLIRAALEVGAPIVAVPGASAVLTALVASGLPMDRFVFQGFPPRKPGPRRRLLASLASLPHSLVFFEAAPRLPGFLTDLGAVLGDRRIAVGRELTKRFEEVWRGTVSEYLATKAGSTVKGEITVVVAGAERRGPRREEPGDPQELESPRRSRAAARRSDRQDWHQEGAD